ncbi:hypothetical protein N9W57_03725 [Pseudomonadales bacterium]|nr:hypothetical protein [Pseudomonadales bacterium]
MINLISHVDEHNSSNMSEVEQLTSLKHLTRSLIDTLDLTLTKILQDDIEAIKDKYRVKKLKNLLTIKKEINKEIPNKNNEFSALVKANSEMNKLKRDLNQ